MNDSIIRVLSCGWSVAPLWIEDIETHITIENKDGWRIIIDRLRSLSQTDVSKILDAVTTRNWVLFGTQALVEMLLRVSGGTLSEQLPKI